LLLLLLLLLVVTTLMGVDFLRFLFGFSSSSSSSSSPSESAIGLKERVLREIGHVLFCDNVFRITREGKGLYGCSVGLGHGV
jgi:hypothetical protein